MKNTAIVWFKTDLRLQDNESLCKAILANDQIIPVYCLTNAQFSTTSYGFKKTGNFRAQFLLEALTDLNNQLIALGSGLLVLRGKPEIEIYNLAQKFDVQKVYAQKETAYEEIEIENAVINALKSLNCSLETCYGSTLLHPADLTFAIKNLPDVFTEFRKRVENVVEVRPLFLKPKTINSPKILPLHLPTLTELGLTPVLTDKRAALNFSGGATAAQQRIKTYFFETKSVATYKETRNQLIGENYSTKFSAWLALGCISVKEIYHELKKFETQHLANSSTYWVFFELLWRDYFAFVMQKYGNLFFLKIGIKGLALPQNKHCQKTLNSWINGNTGIDFVDANMIELKLTGFMSNRGRQNVASYLCNNLKLDWRYGAAYFEQQLIDYDVSSNWCNWAYLAGVGNDPRTNRYFNSEKQAATYDAQQEFRKLWLQKI